MPYIVRSVGRGREEGQKIEAIVNFTVGSNASQKAQKVVDIFVGINLKKVNPVTMKLMVCACNHIFDCLIKENLNHSGELASALRQGNPIKIIEKSLLCIYDVRIKIFHGYLTPEQVEQKRNFVYLCSVFLDYFLAWAFNCFVYDEFKKAGI